LVLPTLLLAPLLPLPLLLPLLYAVGAATPHEAAVGAGGGGGNGGNGGAPAAAAFSIAPR